MKNLFKKVLSFFTTASENPKVQAVKFTVFSMSAGIVQALSFALFHDVLGWENYWMSHVPSLVLSVIRQLGLLLPLMLVMTSLFGETGLICAQPAADMASLFIGIVIYAMLMRKDGQAE